jgi:hypothetical protein
VGWIAFILTLLMVILGGSFVLRSIGLEQEQRQLHQQAELDAVAAEKTAELVDELAAADLVLDEQIELAEGMVASRTLFVEQVVVVSAALDSGAGKIDVATFRQRVLDAQDAVLAATDAASIDSQTKALQAITAEITASVEAHDAEAARRSQQAAATSASSVSPRRSSPQPPAAGTSVSGGDWFSEMRGILNSVGGGSITLVVYDGNCGGGTAPACSFRGKIGVTQAIAAWSPVRKSWGMAHEVAHQYQYRVWDQLMASPTYQQLFGSNIELLANCMTTSRGHTVHGQYCSPQMVSWAANIYNGVVTG